MQQLTWKQAEKVARKAADRALGFGPRTGPVTTTAEEVLRVATDAAINALRSAGALTSQDQADRRWNDAQADKATARQQAFENFTKKN